MPDVTITCPSCGKTITVSEFVDLSQLVCRSCGGRFAVSAAEPESEVVPEDAAQEAESADEPVVTITEPAPAIATVRVTPKTRRWFRWTYQMQCWTAFACIGVVSLVVRYGGVLGRDGLEVLVEYGPLVVLTLHLYVTFRAFRESVLAGILCLLVPFYTLYYAFWTFEDYMFRAIFAGILVGTGADTLAFMYHNAEKILPAINDFLTSGL